MDDSSTGERLHIARMAFVLIFAGMIANPVIAEWAYGDDARYLFLPYDWLGDFLKHVRSFPGPPIHSSVLAWQMEQFQLSQADPRIGHFHNMPLTVLITLGWRQLFALMDPAILYFVMAGCFVMAWSFLVHRFTDEAARPTLLALALFNSPMITLVMCGNLFAGAVAACLAAMLCRRKLDWTAVLLLVVAANIRPNVVIMALPLLLSQSGAIRFVIRTGIVGTALAAACLIIDGVIYPAYTVPAVLRGLALYNEHYVLGPLGVSFGSSLWGAVRHVVPVAGPAVTVCTLVGLLPLLLAWIERERLSYAASCFLTITACTLSTAVFADYHLLIFVVPIILLRRDDAAFWPILLGACWMLVPKHYNPEGVLSWQTYFNPAGVIVATGFIVWTSRRGRKPEAVPAPAVV